MYTLLITENNELITSIQERIMQRSKLIDKLHFLTAPMYKDHDMREFSLMMEVNDTNQKFLHCLQNCIKIT